MANPMYSTDLFDVKGKVAVVTGGSRGIGAMIARGLVSNGVKTYITARKAQPCDEMAAELSKIGECISIPADLSTDEGLAEFVAAVSEQEPQLDILVNNAGASWGAEMGEFPSIGFDKVLNINVKAPFMLTQAFLPLLKASGTQDDPGRVIMISSIDGIRVSDMPTFSYSASKAGVAHMGRQMAKNLAPEHITVNMIAPGPFESHMMAFALEDEKMRAAIESDNPRNRIGSPEDVAGTTIFLCSRAGAYVTGAIIAVDGGMASLAS